MSKQNKNTPVDSRLARRLRALNGVLSRAAVGDFSKDLRLPATEDELTEVFAGVQVMQEVIREKIADLERLNADLGRKVAERTRSLELLQAITEQANAAESIRAAYSKTLGVICQHMGWPLGHVYEVDPSAPLPLRSTTIWHVATPKPKRPSPNRTRPPKQTQVPKAQRFAAFRTFTEVTHQTSGSGLPGHVYQRGRPIWMADVTTDSRFARPKAAKASGLGAGFAFPVRAGRETIAILEFFSNETAEPDQDFLAMVDNLGTQLGAVIARKRAESIIRINEERLRALTGAANDAIISADDHGRIMSWNQGAVRMFGYSEREATGERMDLIMPKRFRRAHAKGIKRVRQTGRTKIVGSTVELVGLRKDGTEFSVELALSQWQTEQGKFFTGIIRDITERKKAEEKLKTYTAELERLNQAMVGRELKMVALKEELAALKRT